MKHCAPAQESIPREHKQATLPLARQRFFRRGLDDNNPVSRHHRRVSSLAHTEVLPRPDVPHSHRAQLQRLQGGPRHTHVLGVGGGVPQRHRERAVAQWFGDDLRAVVRGWGEGEGEDEG